MVASLSLGVAAQSAEVSVQDAERARQSAETYLKESGYWNGRVVFIHVTPLEMPPGLPPRVAVTHYRYDGYTIRTVVRIPHPYEVVARPRFDYNYPTPLADVEVSRAKEIAATAPEVAGFLSRNADRMSQVETIVRPYLNSNPASAGQGHRLAVVEYSRDEDGARVSVDLTLNRLVEAAVR